ncbi:MAG TPA: NADH-quinone oxidoreductase subunit N, partial [Acidobacteriota bacterium]|nr:NADH-quinone oxidoreductase subunit N [Acidobacteriota bacterium]
MPIAAVAPLLSLTAGALAALLLEAFLGRKARGAPAWTALAGLAAAGWFVARSWGLGLTGFGGRLVLDPLALLVTAVVIAVAVFVLLMSLGYAPRRAIDLGQLSGLLLFAVAGLAIMVSTTDWLIIFLGLEVMSVASYALAGLRRDDRASAEAAAKYFLMGSFAGAFFVLGLAVLFGISGELSLAASLGSPAGAPSATAAVGLALVLAALFFKIAVAPFHMWAPDVYQGAPTPVTAFLTIAPKAAGLAVLLRALGPMAGRGGAAPLVLQAVAAVAVLTMFAGNLAALRQTDAKRLLAYSAIAHSGYLLVAVVAADGAGLVFYLVAYAFMNAGAFAVLAAMSGNGEERTAVTDLTGLGRRHPWLAASLTVFLLSLAGIPPTAGFLAKFTIFGAAVAKGHIALVVAAVLASLVSVAYYFKVIVAMYMREPAAETS